MQSETRELFGWVPGGGKLTTIRIMPSENIAHQTSYGPDNSLLYGQHAHWRTNGITWGNRCAISAPLVTLNNDTFSLSPQKLRRRSCSSFPRKSSRGGVHSVHRGRGVWGMFEMFPTRIRSPQTTRCSSQRWRVVNHPIFQTTVELMNMTSVSRHIRVIPPTTPYFSIGLGKLLRSFRCPYWSSMCVSDCLC